MRSPIPDYLAEVLEEVRGDERGDVADYIPELARANPDLTAIALATVEGSVYCVGEAGREFSIQSMSKPFTYSLALGDQGFDDVAARIGVEPSGEAFNEISLEAGTGRPLNPMINAGAIAAHSLVRASSTAERDRRVLEHYSAFAGRELGVAEEVFESEQSTGHRNLGLGHLMKAFGIIDDDPVDVVNGYIRQCSVSVTVRDLAHMAATLANAGVQPVTGERVVRADVVRHVLSVMTSCGMYDAAGDWLTTVGIPAKSGVAGGIIGVLPGQVGVAVFSPRLDVHGNSVRGIRVMERLSRDLGMHLMEATRPSRSAIRDHRVESVRGEDVTVYELQGDLVFVSTESLIRHAVENPPSTRIVVFDLHRVDEISDVARKMSAEAARRMKLDGHRVVLVDPNGVLPSFDLGDGTTPEYSSSIADIDVSPR
ncbi:glutaminase [Zhihengliuella salsuginis]|uniref:Glutaminase n=1 Tax=Zhihengliuella salsuginis TaxID=578222 RepID=A0ABQ3GB18_9MICC|nr:glutaminase [Zhihengliuella salsuginis]GHC99361.1 glutaminase [Zhihengliuella salsuginis]